MAALSHLLSAVSSAVAVGGVVVGAVGGGLGGPARRVGSAADIAAAQYARPVSGDQPIDPRQAAFFARPDYYDVLARLRAEDPVHECEPGFWVLSRYDDIRDLSRDPQRFCSGRGALVNDPLRSSGNPMAAPSLLHMDPPEHASFRRLVNRRFTPRALSGLAESIRTTAVDAARRGGGRTDGRSTSCPSWRRRSP